MCGVLRPGCAVVSKYEFIESLRLDVVKYAFPVEFMCRHMGVSRSGFYEWRSRPASATAERRDFLGTLIRKSFEDSDETYGHRRVHAELARWGVQCGVELVRAIMRMLELEPCQPRPRRRGLTEQGASDLIPDLVKRDFTASRPGQKLVGDITYIPTWEGWLYLATVLDCCTKEVVGYAMADNYRTPLIEDAIHMAVRNHSIGQGAIFHSDRGSNYTSSSFAGTLKRLNIRQSVGRTGVCYDNSMAESFFGTLKNELVHRVVYSTRTRAKADIARYIELRYNTRRLHSALGYRTPREVRNEHGSHIQAA
jgi:transposase InsO family protein